VYEGAGSHTAEEGMAYEVVTKLLTGLEGRWHTVVCDNLFSSPRLFHDLMTKGFWAIGTLRPNKAGMPHSMVLHKGETRKCGSLVIKMHRHRQMCVMNWQDSGIVRLLSTKQDPWRPNCNVVRRERGRRFHMVVLSTLVQEEYEEFMRGVDVCDHLRGLYTIQMGSKKWWQKVMVFTFDQGLVNQYIMYLERCVELDQKPLTHMQFHMAIADYLVAPAILVRESK
jgi:hypothetical protein